MWTNTFYKVFDRVLLYMKIATLLAVLSLLTAGGFYLLAHPEPGKSWTESDLNGQNGLKTKITGFKLSEKSGNEDKWSLTAETVYVTGGTTEMDGVAMRFARALKRDTSFDLTSQKAVMDNATKNITFIGNVLVKMPRPLSLHTESLIWNAEKRTISTDEVVKMETSSAVVNGRGMDIDLDRQSFTVKNAVQALFY
ncbi:MAG: LPS export ABC transporter periplasmic protein LptC [Nitrospinae bacterium]|nr:LPS export ABC transporter periplasmic protein LptC [Nitrospinota bacterium]